MSYETYYENTPEKKNGVSAAWKGHTVSKTTVTSARKGIDYNNVKEVKEKRAREGYYKPEDNVLFVHTGGAAGLFAQDWENM